MCLKHYLRLDKLLNPPWKKIFIENAPASNTQTSIFKFLSDKLWSTLLGKQRKDDIGWFSLCK